MKKLLKIGLGVLVALLVLAVVAALVLPMVVDPNDYKARINQTLEGEIGRQVTIKGDIDLSVFPWLGVTLGEVDVANAPGFGDQPLAKIASAEVSVRLVPLLSREVQVGTVSLDGLRLRLARNPRGRSNWAGIAEHLQQSQDGEKEASAPAGSEPPDQHGFELSSLQVAAVDVQDAAVSWHDGVTGADYRATGVNLTTGRLTDGEPTRLELGGDFAAPARKINGHVDLVSRVEPHIADQRYRFSDLKLNALVSGQAVPNGRQQATLGGHGELDLGKGRFKLDGLTLQAAGLNATGEIDGQGLRGTPSYSGEFAIKPFDPRAVLKELAIEVPATQKSDALSSAAFEAQFEAHNDRVQFDQIQASLDASNLKGGARVSHFARPEIGFDLSLDQLDVDDYLPPGSAEQAQGAPAETDGDASHKQAEIDLSILDGLRLDGTLAAQSLTVANIHATDAQVQVKARDGVLSIAPLTAQLYNGNVSLHASVDASKKQPRYALSGTLDGLRLARLLHDVAGTDRIDATTHVNLDLRTAGRQVAALKRGLDGQLGFNLRDGAFSGFNLARIIAAARARLSEDTADASNASAPGKRMPFNRLAASFDVKQGVLSGRDLKLTTPSVDATGAGSYDLADNALDYTLKALVPKNASGELEKLAGVTVPIQLKGNLLSPSYSLDMAGVLRSVADQRLDKGKSKLRDKLQKQLDKHRDDVGSQMGDRLKEGLNSLFGGQSKSDDDAGADRAQ